MQFSTKYNVEGKDYFCEFFMCNAKYYLYYLLKLKDGFYTDDFGKRTVSFYQLKYKWFYSKIYFYLLYKIINKILNLSFMIIYYLG